MKIFKTPLEKRIANKFREIEEKMKLSFSLIHKDVSEMQEVVERMREFIKKREKDYEKSSEKARKVREELERDVDEFSQKISELRMALKEFRKLKENVVMIKDLAQIEDRVKRGFKEELEELREEVREQRKMVNLLEKGAVEKKGWFGFLKGKE